MNSIIQEKKRCIITGAETELHEHHVCGGTAGRKMSEEYGLKVWLRHDTHNLVTLEDGYFEILHALGLVRIPYMDFLHIVGQMAFEDKHGSREEFRLVFGRSYI